MPQLAEVSGMSVPSLSRWSTADGWIALRQGVETQFDEDTIARIQREAELVSDGENLSEIDTENHAIAETKKEIIEKLNTIADKHVDTIHEAIKIQNKHILAFKQSREIGVLFNTCFIHILTRISAGATPDQNILKTFEEMMRRGGNSPIKVYNDMLERAIAGEERIYGLNQMRDLRAAEATLASAGYAIVEAKALQEAKQLQEGEIEGEIVENE
jgi:hypothetical protein